MTKTLILFDVDGTLTESRKVIKQNMVDTLNKLKDNKNLDIGIVGGSDLKKQKEQLGEDKLTLFNYVFSENGLVAFENGELFHSQSIIDTLGEKHYKALINICFEALLSCDPPKKRGTFIESRTGMINVSPIGRSCSQEERDQFYELDLIHKYRGWDKTYCLQFIENKYDKILFFGDRTMKGGNDYEIFNHPLTESYSVNNPEDTIKILNQLFN